MIRKLVSHLRVNPLYWRRIKLRSYMLPIRRESTILNIYHYRQFGSKLQEEKQEHKFSYTINIEDIKGSKAGGDGIYLILFTCDICQAKNARTFTKKAYNEGVVIIKCPGCQNNHLIADHLGWFRDQSVNIEDLVREKGQEVVRILNKEAFEVISAESAEELK